MARRVNTKFVLGLGGGLVILGGGAAAIGFRSWLHDRDPVYLKSQAEAAETRGDGDLALTLYRKAAARALATHMVGADALCLKLGDMALAQSAKETAPDKAQGFYGLAMNAWQSALTENPTNIAAREKLVEQQHLIAEFAAGDPKVWATLQEQSQKLANDEPKSANAYLYMAESQYSLFRQGSASAGTLDQAASEIEKNLEKALSLDPTLGKAVAIHSRVLELRAIDAQQQGNRAIAQKLAAQEVSVLTDFLKQHPNNPDAAIALADAYAHQNKIPEGTRILEAAFAAHPTDGDIGSTLAARYRLTGQSDQAEKVLKDLIAAQPADAEGYVRLGLFYRQSNQHAKAIAAFKDVIAHPTPGGGIAIEKNSRWQTLALYYISSSYMSLVDAEGATSTEGKADLAQASTYADKLRTANSNSVLQSVLDGRMQLARQNIPQALSYLKRADANLGTASPQANPEQWIEVKTLLARCYESQQEWGNALQYMDQVHTNFPTYLPATVARANYLNRIGRFSEALASIDPLITADQPAAVKKILLRTKVQSLFGMGNHEEGEAILKTLDSSSAGLVAAQQHLLEGQYEAALSDVADILEKDPTNATALRLACAANSQLGKTAEAQALVKRGLEKHPDDTQLQLLQATLNNPKVTTLDGNLEIVKSISDEYTRDLMIASLYGQAGDLKKQLGALQDAEKVADTDGANTQRIAPLVDKAFTLVLVLAERAADNEKATYWDQAGKYVQKADRLNLDGVNGKSYQGRLLFAQGDQKGGLQALEQSVAARPDSPFLHTMLADRYFQASQLDSALDQYRQAIREKPDFVAALKGAIQIILVKADPAAYDEARTDLKQAILFAPRDGQLVNFGDTLWETAEAIRIRENIFKNAPANLDNQVRLASLYGRAKEPEKAIALLKPLLDSHPEDLGLANALANQYAAAGKKNDALVVYEKFADSKNADVRCRALILMGNLRLAMGQRDEAIQILKEAIQQQPPGMDLAQRQLADIYFNAGAFKESAALYQQIYDNAKTKDRAVLTQLIRSQIGAGDFANSDKLITTELFKNSPDDPVGVGLQGYTLLRQNKPAESLVKFNKILAADPANVEVLYYRATADVALHQDLDQAAQDLLVVRNRNPSNIAALSLLAKVYRASQHYAEAASAYRDLLNAHPELVDVRVDYADMLLGLVRAQVQMNGNNQGDMAIALRSLRPADLLQNLIADSIERYPQEPLFLKIRGDLYTGIGRLDDAVKSYADAYSLSKNSPQLALPYIESLMKNHDSQKAIDLATQLIAAMPQNPDWYIHRASAELQLHKTDDAMADYAQAFQISPNVAVADAVVRAASDAVGLEKMRDFLRERLKQTDNAATRLSLADTSLSLNDPTAAANLLKPLDSVTAQPDRSILLRIRSMVRYQLKDFAGSVADYQELLKSSPEDVNALNNLSFMLADDMKQPREALPYAEKAKSLVRDTLNGGSLAGNAQIYDTVGWVKFLAGDSDGAIADLQRAVQLDPLAVGYFHLAKVYQKAGRPDDAVRTTQNGLQLAQKNDPAFAQLETLNKELNKR